MVPLEDAGFTQKEALRPQDKNFSPNSYLFTGIGISAPFLIIGARLTDVNVKAVSNAVPYASRLAPAA